MKLKLLAYTLFVPLAWLTLILIKLTVPDLSLSRFFSSGILIGLFVGSLLGRLFLNRKYLIDLTIDNNIIKLTYLNSFAKNMETTISTDSLTDIKMKERIFFIRDWDLIIFFQNGNQSKFQIYNSSVGQTLEKLMQSYSVVTKPVLK